ncbi:MAG: permease, partial [Planctomycetaceae bacterium]
IVRELRRCGLSGGTIFAFAISAPLFNPLSLLYGLTLSEPTAIISFAGCSLVIVTLLGVLWDKLFPDSALPVPDEEPIEFGVRRVAAAGVAAGRDITGRSTLFILVGLIGTGVLGVLLPANSLQASFNHDNVLAPLHMLGLAVPVYATPMLAMAQMGMMFQHANSIGAAFILLTLGAGMNLGLLGWLSANYGIKRTVVWMALLGGIALGLAYAVDGPLFPSDVQPAGHTHAFDVYCQPFTPGVVSDEGYQSDAMQKLEKLVQPFEFQAFRILVGCLVVGFLVRLIDMKGHAQRWIEAGRDGELKRDVILPTHVLGGLVLLVVVAVSVAGCYAYYPPPKVVLKEMFLAKGEALHGALIDDATHATYWIDGYTDWSRKLEVGVFIRHGSVSDYHHWKARVLREQLELLEHTIEDGETEETRKWIAKVGRTHARLVTAYSEEL